MQISHTAGGALRVLLSDNDLSRFGTDFAALREGDPQTKAVIRRILRAVFDKEALPNETALTVEAIPTDGGCLLLITPHTHANQNVYTVTVADDSTLLQLKEAIHTRLSDCFISVIAYRLSVGYGIVLYCERLCEQVQAVLHEFGSVYTGSVPAAQAAEYAVSEAMYNF